MSTISSDLHATTTVGLTGGLTLYTLDQSAAAAQADHQRHLIRVAAAEQRQLRRETRRQARAARRARRHEGGHRPLLHLLAR